MFFTKRETVMFCHLKALMLTAMMQTLIFVTAIGADIAPPLGLPPIPWPNNNPYTEEKAELGRQLFHDTRLSSDQSVACVSCHNKTCSYSDCRTVSVGIDEMKGTRHSPSLINAAYLTSCFWDGRAQTLEDQCEGPLTNPKEMTSLNDPHAALKHCAEQVCKIIEYRPLIKQVFGKEEITITEISQAIATYERTILSGNSPYDRYIAGDRTALSAEQIQGFAIFKKSGCINCHSEPLFTDNRFHNIGVGMDRQNPDTGRYGVTHQEKDWGAFKTPGLRDVARSGPYMHDGSLKTLEEVIDYYDKGGINNKNLHPLMRPLNLTAQEKTALLKFLESLNGEPQ